MNKKDEDLLIYLANNLSDANAVFATLGAYHLPSLALFKTCVVSQPKIIDEIYDGILCVPPEMLTPKQKKIRDYVAYNF